jgi:hypothetical protein
MSEITRSSCPYTAYFCEENAWLIAERLRDQGRQLEAIEILLFTNPNESVLLHEQRGAPPGQPLIWDYHVVVRLRADRDVIIDPDSRLELPCDAQEYLRKTFADQARLAPGLRTRVRVIPASAYLERFHSDRSHMRGQIADSAFPDYPCIESPAVRRVPLASYRDLQQALDDGSQVVDVTALFEPPEG